MVYLDNAATSFPKPPSVISEVERCMREYCGNPGRGAHALALASAEMIYNCREGLCELFSAPSPERVVFTQNTTMALGIAIAELGRIGGHVIASNLEHNSVRRPLLSLESEGKISLSVFDATAPTTSAICEEISSLVRNETIAVVCTAASNVCSIALPLLEIGRLCHRNNLLFIVDGAQAAGHLDISIKDYLIDALCVPGHKGLWGPQGSGALILGNSFSPSPIILGGSGSASLSPKMPLELPERLEAGTLSTPAIAGLARGIEALRAVKIKSIRAHEQSLYLKARRLLSTLNECKLYAPNYIGSVLSFNIKGISSERVAQMLSERDICVRGGFHCAPWAHKALATGDLGCVRASFSYFNTKEDIDALFESVCDIINKK